MINALRILSLIILILGSIAIPRSVVADDLPLIRVGDNYGKVRAAVGEPINMPIGLEKLPASLDTVVLELRGFPDSMTPLTKIAASTGETWEYEVIGSGFRITIPTGGNPTVSGALAFEPSRKPILLSNLWGYGETPDEQLISVVPATVAVAYFANPVSIFGFFGAIVALVFYLSTLARLKPIFRYLPPVIWMYFIPMFATTIGLTPDTSALYSPFMTRVLLPATLILLLISADLRGVVKIGPMALLMMLWATASIVIGGIAAFGIVTFVAPGALPDDAWKGVSALAGSWIGGSANMTAVIGSLDVSPTIIGPLIIMDTVLVYSWLAVLVTLSNYHIGIDKHHGAKTEIVTKISENMALVQAENARPIKVADAAMMVGLAFALGQVCMSLGPILFDYLSSVIPTDSIQTLREIANPFTISILLITVIGVALSLTKLRKLEHCGASSLGYVGFYFVLCGYGAQANLSAITELPIFFLLGIIWLLIHIIFLYIGMRVLRAPLFLAATSSMANMGGPSSAPLVAAAYYQSMAPLGLLKAVLGGVLGTPIALFVVGVACRAIAGSGQ